MPYQITGEENKRKVKGWLGSDKLNLSSFGAACCVNPANHGLFSQPRLNKLGVEAVERDWENSVN